MNISGAEAGAIQNASQWVWASSLTDVLLPRGGYYWNGFPGGFRATPLDGGPTKDSCAAGMRGACTRPYGASMTMQHDPANADQTVAGFLITRGPLAWIGWGWQGCSVPPWPPQFDMDVGEPLGNCTEGPAGVFSRVYSKGTATLDCNTWAASLPFETSSSWV